MDINGVNATSSVSEYVNVKNSNKNSTAKSDSAANKESAVKSNSASDNQSTPSAVYEKSSDSTETKKVYKQDTATIEQMKAEADKRTQQLRSLVEKMLLKQGQTLEDADMYKLLREGKVPVDAETAAQAKKDVAEDGYWGANQTSDRFVSFAMALAGGDPSKADLMIDAVKEGFKQATEAWGDDLPELCKKTLDLTLKKLDDWKNSVTETTA
jgi:hypothetical protein